MAELGCVQQGGEAGLFGCSDSVAQGGQAVVAAAFVIECRVGSLVGGTVLVVATVMVTVLG